MDGSDENECTYIKINADQYRKEFNPQNQIKVEVKVGFDVLDIVEISEPKERELIVIVLSILIEMVYSIII